MLLQQPVGTDRPGASALLESTADCQGECEMLWAKLAGTKVHVCPSARVHAGPMACSG